MKHVYQIKSLLARKTTFADTFVVLLLFVNKWLNDERRRYAECECDGNGWFDDCSCGNNLMQTSVDNKNWMQSNTQIMFSFPLPFPLNTINNNRMNLMVSW